MCIPFSAVGGSESGVEGKRPFRVLVVDDDASIRRMIVAALRRGPYEFFEAQNGKEGLDLMRSERPDVVVLDLMMPVVSGWDVLRERQAHPELQTIPVILISANRDPEIASAVDQGVCAFLPKPFDIGALSALVQSCVGTEGGAA
ncbi:MAG TPA: response regulator [Thermoanaerobaculia bacterium]|nr:response regulator [Thermoanaerobaculia bacterium]